MELNDVLQIAMQFKASDITLVAGLSPCLRVNGEIIRTDLDPLTPTSIKEIIYKILSNSQKKFFEKNRDLDFAYSIPGIGRFRINVHSQRSSIAVSIRLISNTIPTGEELGIPIEILDNIAQKTKGLVIVSGSTGSGKSTTLAAIIDMINRKRKAHIITIEDPIEFLHKHNLSIIEQREVYSDTASFYSALKFAMRQDPDIIMIGEMRDLETISLAITAAETGHLVLSTLHTTGAIDTIGRIVDVYPTDKRSLIQSQLSNILEAVISQHLFPARSGEGRVLIPEILLGTHAIKNLIRKGDMLQIAQAMETGSKYGMVTLEKSLQKAYKNNIISSKTMTDFLSNYKLGKMTIQK